MYHVKQIAKFDGISAADQGKNFVQSWQYVTSMSQIQVHISQEGFRLKLSQKNKDGLVDIAEINVTPESFASLVIKKRKNLKEIPSKFLIFCGIGQSGKSVAAYSS
jgi:hypothetical protein